MGTRKLLLPEVLTLQLEEVNGELIMGMLSLLWEIA